MKVILETPTLKECKGIYNKYNTDKIKPTDLLRTLIIYMEEYEINLPPESVTYPKSTLDDLEVVLFKWEKYNARVRQNKEWHKDKNFGDSGNPFTRMNEV